MPSGVCPRALSEGDPGAWSPAVPLLSPARGSCSGHHSPWHCAWTLLLLAVCWNAWSKAVLLQRPPLPPVPSEGVRVLSPCLQALLSSISAGKQSAIGRRFPFPWETCVRWEEPLLGEVSGSPRTRTASWISRSAFTIDFLWEMKLKPLFAARILQLLLCQELSLYLARSLSSGHLSWELLCFFFLRFKPPKAPLSSLCPATTSPPEVVHLSQLLTSLSFCRTWILPALHFADSKESDL